MLILFFMLNGKIISLNIIITFLFIRDITTDIGSTCIICVLNWTESGVTDL